MNNNHDKNSNQEQSEELNWEQALDVVSDEEILKVLSADLASGCLASELQTTTLSEEKRQEVINILSEKESTLESMYSFDEVALVPNGVEGVSARTKKHQNKGTKVPLTAKQLAHQVSVKEQVRLIELSFKNTDVMSTRLQTLSIQADKYLKHAPSHERYALCLRISNCIYDLIDLIITVNHKYHNTTTMTKMVVTHEKLRAYFAIFYKKGHFNFKTRYKSNSPELDAVRRFRYINILVDEIGRMIGALLKR